MVKYFWLYSTSHAVNKIIIITYLKIISNFLPIKRIDSSKTNFRVKDTLSLYSRETLTEEQVGNISNHDYILDVRDSRCVDASVFHGWNLDRFVNQGGLLEGLKKLLSYKNINYIIILCKHYYSTVVFSSSTIYGHIGPIKAQPCDICILTPVINWMHPFPLNNFILIY